MRTHQHQFRPIYGDTDMMGIIYYGNYLRFFEAGRTEFMRAAGLPYAEVEAKGFTLPVVEAKVRYRAPAHYDELLTLDVTIDKMRLGTVHFTYRLVRESDGTLICTGSTRHACLGKDGKVCRIPEDVADRLQDEGSQEDRAQDDAP